MNAQRIEDLANEADVYALDAAAFNCLQRAEHHKETAAVLRELAKQVREGEAR